MDVQPYIRSYDMLVLPSRLDGRPVVVLEALAMGVPVIASHVGGLPEVVTTGVNGYLCEPRDYDGFAARIAQLAQDAGELRRLKTQARLFAESNLDAERMLQEYTSGRCGRPAGGGRRLATTRTEAQPNASSDPRRRPGDAPAPVHHHGAEAVAAAGGDRPVVEILLDPVARRRLHPRARPYLGHMAPRCSRPLLATASRADLQIEYIVEQQPLGTAGALLQVPDLDDDFLVVNGDTLTDISFSGLLAVHQQAGAYRTIFSAKVDEFVDYGVVEFDQGTRRLLRYAEKPTRHYYVSTGIYALSRNILQFAQGTARLDMPDLLRTAAENRHVVNCYTEDGAYWRDIGRFDHYEAASREYQATPGNFSKASRGPTG